jgi:hypothetical protein
MELFGISTRTCYGEGRCSQRVVHQTSVPSPQLGMKLMALVLYQPAWRHHVHSVPKAPSMVVGLRTLGNQENIFYT